MFMTPWMNPTWKPARHQFGLPGDDAFQQRDRGNGLRRLRIVPGDRMVGEAFDAPGIAAGRKILERAGQNVARRHAGQHRARQRRLAHDAFADVFHGERSRG